MAPPPLGAPDGSMLPEWSVDSELAARMDKLGVVPEAGAAPRATSGRPSRTHPRGRTNRELLNLESASAKPHPCDDTSDLELWDSGTTSARSSSTRKPSHSTSRPSGSAPESSRSSSGRSGSTSGPSAKGDAKDSGSSSSTKERLKNIGFVAGVAVVAGAAAVAAAPLALAAAGFTSSGVAAGSMAATYQATLGGVIAKGSMFAAMQSAGAAGLSAAAQVMTATVGAAVGGSTAAACRKRSGGNETGGGDGGDGAAGTESEAANGAKQERLDLTDEDDACAEIYMKSTDRKRSKKAEEQEPSRQNVKNEEAARKRDAFRK